MPEPEGTVTPMFCPTCDHPPEYHHPERGCTMPPRRTRPPRTAETVGACHCGESMRHKRERLRAAMYAAKAVFKDAERAYTEELHAQRVALSEFSGGIERGRE